MRFEPHAFTATEDTVAFRWEARGTYKGVDHYGIRAVRSERWKYVVNLTPEVAFEFPQPRSGAFRSWAVRA